MIGQMLLQRPRSVGGFMIDLFSTHRAARPDRFASATRMPNLLSPLVRHRHVGELLPALC